MRDVLLRSLSSLAKLSGNDVSSLAVDEEDDREFVEALKGRFRECGPSGPTDQRVGSLLVWPPPWLDDVDVEREVQNNTAHPPGLSIESLHNHSWSNGTPRWYWIRRGFPLSSSDLGFPACPDEIRRFGGSVVHIRCAKPRYIDSRSFTQVVAGGSMDKHWGAGRFKGKRSVNDRDDAWSFDDQGAWVDRGDRGARP
ncbi:hypothetical protein ABZP36_009215 [Zizania latifolia]